MANDIFDNKTKNLGLPLPNVRNKLANDCPRIAESLNIVDEHIGDLETGAKANGAAILALQKRASALEDVDIQHNQQISSLAETLASDEEEIAALDQNLAEEKTERENAMQAHDDSTDAHAALFNHLITGSLSPVIGICLAEEGGGAGSWVNVDIDGNPVNPPKAYFDHHPVYSKIRRVLVDGQMMQEHSKFYYKACEIKSGLLAGKRTRIISPEPKEGFKLFPTFLKDGNEIDHWYCGTYQAVDTTPDAATNDKRLGSRPGKKPFTTVDYPTMQALCRNRNVNGVTGFDMWNIYQLSEIQLLYLIEYSNSDSRAAIGPGWSDGQWRSTDGQLLDDSRNVDDPAVASASWRGHVGLWGNVWQRFDGLYIRDSDKHYMIYKNDGSAQWIDTGVVGLTHGYNNGYMCNSWPVSFLDVAGDGFDLSEVFLPGKLTIDAHNASIPDVFLSWRHDWPVNQDRYCQFGGGWGYNYMCGLFTCLINAPVTHYSVHIGCRIARR